MFRRPLLKLVVVALVLLAGADSHLTVNAAVDTYDIVDVGTLVGTGDGQFDSLTATNPLGMNEDGEVAGVALSSTQPSWSVAFTSTSGKIRRLGKESQYSFAFDISDAGDVVGFVKTKTDTSFTHQTPAVWRDRKLIKLPTLGGNSGTAFSIGPNGDIVGSSTIQSGDDSPSHATLWRKDQPVDLGTAGGVNSLAYGLNAKAEIVGWSNAEGDTVQHPCIWRDGKPELLSLTDGMVSGFISNINEAGEMTGTEFDAAGYYYAVHWIDGKPELLPGSYDGAIGSAGDIDEEGRIVGTTASGADSGAPLVGAMWIDGQLSLLQGLIPADSGYTIGTTAGINEAGQIVASATTADGIRHGVLLTPGAKSGLHFAKNVAFATRSGRLQETLA